MLIICECFVYFILKEIFYWVLVKKEKVYVEISIYKIQQVLLVVIYFEM